MICDEAALARETRTIRKGMNAHDFQVYLVRGE